MTALTRILATVTKFKLWPVAILLLGGIAIVPMALSRAPHSTPTAQLPAAGLPVSSLPAGPSISVAGAAAHSRLTAHGRDPFTQIYKAPTATTATSTSSTSSAASGSSASSAGSTPTTNQEAAGVSGTSTTPPSITPGATPKPAPTGLKANQAYHVALEITNSSGGLDSIDPLERLSILPSAQQPLLVELGVLQGGKSVLFAVLPGTGLAGPGACMPGPVDCQILSLGQDQTESVSTGGGQPTMFAITGISVDTYSSAAVASRARRIASAAGQELLSSSTLGALPLFQYDPTVGAVVDQRNLTIGGN